MLNWQLIKLDIWSNGLTSCVYILDFRFRLRLVMLKSQVFFKLATKKVKIFWLFCFCGFTLGKIKQKSKIRKAKKPIILSKKVKKNAEKNLCQTGTVSLGGLRNLTGIWVLPWRRFCGFLKCNKNKQDKTFNKSLFQTWPKCRV